MGDRTTVGPAPVGALPTLEVLGPLTVQVDGSSVPSRGSRQRRLLAILAAAAGQDRSISADELIDGLYGEHAPQRARHSLATELWRARQLLGPQVIITDDGGHRLDLDRCTVDTVEFESLLTQGRVSLREHAYAAAQDALARALGLWRGDPLSDWLDHPGGRAASDRLIELRLGCVEDHAEALIGLGRHSEAIDALDALTAAEPAREHAWALLIECCAQSGHERRARAAFDSARRTLAEYGIDAGAELRAAHDLLDGTRGQPIAAELVGRGAELFAVSDELRTLLTSRRAGAVVVCGEAGIGKSALVAQAASVAARVSGAQLTQLACDRRLDLPYAALRPLLVELAGHVAGHAAPALAGLLDPAAATASPSPAARSWAPGRSELRDAVADLIERAALAVGGLIVVVEDAHWASPELLDTLLHVLARRAAVPLAVLVTVREYESVPTELGPALAELRARADRTVVLAGLDETATAELLGAGVERSEVLTAHELTGGNPLYLKLIAPFRDASIRCASLREAIEGRVACVPPTAIEVLTLAAVAGTQFDLRVLTAAASRQPLQATPAQVADALEAAEAAGLVRGTGDSDYRLGFVHALVRDHLYAKVTAAERRAAHVLIAAAMERVGSVVEPLDGLVAHHYADGWPASPTGTVVLWLRRAGDQAAAQLGFDRAHAYYRRALNIIAMDPEFAEHVLVVDLLDASARAAMAATQGLGAHEAELGLAQARTSFAAMREVAERAELLEARLRAALGTVQTYSLQRIDDRAVDALAAAVAIALPDGTSDPAIVAEAIGALLTYRPVSGYEALERAITAYPDASGLLLGVAWEHQGVPGKVSIARRLVHDRTSDPTTSWLRLWVSEATAGERALDDAPPRPAADSQAQPWELQAWRVTVAIAAGHFAQAERLIAAGRRQLGQGSSATDIARRVGVLRAQHIRMTLLRSAEPPSPDDLAMLHATATITHPVVRTWTAYLAVSTGQTEFAWHVCEEMADELEDGLVPDADLLPQVCALSIAAVAVGHLRCARLCRQALLPHTGRHGIFSVTTYWGSVDHHLGRLAAVLGDLDAAAGHLEAAVDLHRRAGARCYEVQSVRALAAVLWHRDRGADRAEAVEYQRRASAQATRLGLARLVRAEWPPTTPLA